MRLFRFFKRQNTLISPSLIDSSNIIWKVKYWLIQFGKKQLQTHRWWPPRTGTLSTYSLSVIQRKILVSTNIKWLISYSKVIELKIMFGFPPMAIARALYIYWLYLRYYSSSRMFCRKPKMRKEKTKMLMHACMRNKVWKISQNVRRMDLIECEKVNN